MITDRIDAETQIPAAFRNPFCPAPRSIKIEVSPRCPLRCSFCSLKTRETQPREDMDFDLFRRITTEAREAGTTQIGVFYIGESFSAPHLLRDCIHWCKKTLEFPYVFLTSNASLATPGHVEDCMRAGLDSLKWSVNAADEDQYCELMCVSKKYFHRALANIEAAHEVRERGKYKCGLYASSIRYDGEQHEKMQALLDARVRPFVDQHYWLPLFGEMTRTTNERNAELGFVPTAGNQGRLGNLRDPLPCWTVFSGHITADGLLSACCFDADGKFTMADLKEVSLMDGWNSLKFQELRAAHLRKDVQGTACEGCLAYA